MTRRVAFEALITGPDGRAEPLEYNLYLYDIGDRIVVGELTATPAAGRRRFDPRLDRMLGRSWTEADTARKARRAVQRQCATRPLQS